MTPGSEVTIKALKKGFEVLWGEPDTGLCETEAAFTTLDEALAFIRSRMEPEGEGEKPLDKLQRLGQEWDAAAHSGHIVRGTHDPVIGARIRPTILPTPPRHGDFGSRPDEDMA